MAENARYKFYYQIKAEKKRMKLFGVLCVQGIRAQETTDQCEETDLSANYCRTRGKTLDNDKVNVSIKFLFNNF